jgi:major membrane immunogen (membrane-anchored lipoprotein)
MNVSFLQDGQIQSFLRNVEHDIERSGSTGYTMMSYTSYIITNGQTHSVQYQYQSNGKDITLVKQTNNNGKLLRSVYFYDLDSGSLKADDFMENQKIHEKVYKI